jgi:hypothetical protein
VSVVVLLHAANPTSATKSKTVGMREDKRWLAISNVSFQRKNQRKKASE